jgi:hypothetical protein
VTGATVTNTTGPMRFVLPHDPSIFAPFIPLLPLGPEAFGLTPFQADIHFANLIAQVPPGASMAMLKIATGPAPLDHAFKGYSYLLVLNATNLPLFAPKLGTSAPQQSLVKAAPVLGAMAVGGPANDPDFGGGGFQPLGMLGPYGVYVAMVPEGPIDVVVEFRTGKGVVRQSFAAIGDDVPVFVTAAATPFPAIPALHPVGLALIVLLLGIAAWRARRRP